LGVALCATPAAAQTAAAWPEERPPRPLPAREVQFPPYEVRTLPNGMQVVIVLHHEQPAVTLRLLVRAGAAQDPKGKGGLAGLAASLLDQGTATKSAEQIADQIDSIGGIMGTGSSLDYTQLTAVVMKDSFNLGMDLVADLARNPSFAPEEIDRQKQQALSSLQVSQNDPDYLASVLFDRLVYGFHPYGLPGSGTPASLAGISRQDLQAFHKQYFVPNNMILGIVGDVTSRWPPPSVCSAAGRAARWRRWPRPSRRRRPVAWWWSTCRTPSRRRFASARLPFRGSIRTTWRSTWRSRFSAAKGPTGCTPCCAPSAV
jgi:zinc protease